MSDVLSPTPSLLCKLASIAVHADEFLSPQSHNVDRIALESVLADAEVAAWVAAMTDKALAPKKRT